MSLQELVLNRIRNDPGTREHVYATIKMSELLFLNRMILGNTPIEVPNPFLNPDPEIFKILIKNRNYYLLGNWKSDPRTEQILSNGYEVNNQVIYRCARDNIPISLLKLLLKNRKDSEPLGSYVITSGNYSKMFFENFLLLMNHVDISALYTPSEILISAMRYGMDKFLITYRKFPGNITHFNRQAVVSRYVYYNNHTMIEGLLKLKEFRYDRYIFNCLDGELISQPKKCEITLAILYGNGHILKRGSKLFWDDPEIPQELINQYPHISFREIEEYIFPEWN